MSQNDVNQQLQRAADAQQKYSDYLMGLPHVIGVAVGRHLASWSAGSGDWPDRHGGRKLPVAQLAESEIWRGS